MAPPRKEAPAKRPPATTPEARENQLISLAVDLAEKQLREGTASSSVISHFLKRASTRERLEETKLRQETELLSAKVGAIESAKDIKALYSEAISAMRSYQGVEEQDDSDEE